MREQGLFRKIKRTPKAVPNQADKCSEPIEWQDGMVAEVYQGGAWHAGEVTHLYNNRVDPHWYLSFFGVGTSGNLDGCRVRQSQQANEAAVAYYQQEISSYQALIDHRSEKERIAELQKKVNGLVGRQSLTNKGAANSPKDSL